MVVLRSKDRHHEGFRDMGPHPAGLGEHLEFSHLQQNDLRINHKTIWSYERSKLVPKYQTTQNHMKSASRVIYSYV